MKRLPLIVALFSAAALYACGNTSNQPGDTSDDAIIAVDVNTTDTVDDAAVTDTGDRDTTPVDTAPADTTTSDMIDTVQADIPAEDTTTTDTTADVPIEPVTYWNRMAVTIDDPVVNGTYVMNPVDGMSFGYNPDGHEFVTAFDRDWEDETITYLWHLDETTGIHSKKFMTGEVYSALTNFCMDEEWCQFIGYDETNSTWLVAGPRAPAVLKIDSSWAATQTAVAPEETDQPPNGAISYSHIFRGHAFLVYGYLTASSFGDKLLMFDAQTADWSLVTGGLPPVYANGLALMPGAGVLYSVGGITTEDGGETSYAYEKMVEVNLGTLDVNVVDLPEGLAGREGMACAADETNGRLYVFGGAEIVDNWDERLNFYHNDLWVYEDGTWTQVLADGAIGEFRQYGNSWMLKADSTLPNFGKNIGKMMFDDSTEPRLILMGDVPGTSTQIYTLNLSDLVM